MSWCIGGSDDGQADRAGRNDAAGVVPETYSFCIPKRATGTAYNGRSPRSLRSRGSGRAGESSQVSWNTIIHSIGDSCPRPLHPAKGREAMNSEDAGKVAQLSAEDWSQDLQDYRCAPSGQ